ncbi:lactonase family protein [Terriglobus roseus]|uniref:6-phosphogluconolactonase, cycloisomerase 2 family n=1 Tax=Terriglobus roseus TaxID=392734 RepID=A0A1G7LLX8_9BACT|nr:beta-propeller fold lactonase family protein [Terriglobus roseus]SDF50485.1 6-phosphogluconolactonase, cycloisomerase 2 family [Terriglobus roseus]
MKFNQISRFGAASVLSLAACLGLTACSRDYTVGFLYVTSSKASTTTNQNGVLNEFGIDYQTGSLIRLASSGQDTGGRNPVALAITSNQKTVFVVNKDDSNIVNFAIGTDGKLYAQKTVTVAGSFPTALAISGDSKFLYVTFTYQPGYTTANPGPGGVEVFPLSTDSSTGIVSLGTPLSNGGLNYFPVGFSPAGIAVTSNVNNNTPSSINGTDCTDTSCSSYVYVIDQDGNTTNNLLAYRRTLSSGVITAIGQTTIAPGTGTSTGYNSGVLASAIAAVPLGNRLYITDKSANQIIGYTIPSSGVPQAILSGPFATQSQPVGLTIDPRGQFLYTANYNSNTVGAYAIASNTGALSATSTGAQSTGGVGPTCVTIENALGIYLYTSNFLDNTVGGLQLKPATGELVKIRNTPFPASSGPSCAAAVANGTHSTQLVTQ